MEPQIPSRFLEELPEEALERLDYGDAFSGEYGGGWLKRGGKAVREDYPADADPVFEIDADFDPLPDFSPDPEAFEPAPARGLGKKPRLGQTATPRSGPAIALKPGDLVRHPQFGSGKVLATDSRRVMVQFFASGTRMFHWDLAQLTRD